MASIFACSFGCRMTGGAGFGGIAHWQTPTGTGMSYDNSVPPPDVGSGYRLLVDTTGGAQTTYIVRTFAAGLQVSSHRFYYRLETAPNAGGSIYSTTGGACNIVVLTNRTIQARATTGGTLVGSLVLNLDQDYLIEAVFTTNGTTWTVDWSVDGAAQPQASTAGQAATDQATVRLGAANSSMAMKARYAHLLIGNSAADAFGEGTVEMFPLVSTPGTHSFTAGDFQDDSSNDLTTSETASHARIDEAPATATDFIKQVVIRSTGYVEHKYATGASGRVPIGVEQVIAGHNLSTQAHTQKLQLNDGTTQTDAYAATSFGTSAGVIVTGSKHWTASPSGAWTGALFDLLQSRWGFSTDITNNPCLDATWLEAAFPPAVAAMNDPMGMTGYFGG